MFPLEKKQSRPDNNKNIITVVSGAAVFVVMNIVIIKVRRGSGIQNARRRKFPRGPSLKE
jgi:hypothetical protein